MGKVAVLLWMVAAWLPAEAVASRWALSSLVCLTVFLAAKGERRPVTGLIAFLAGLFLGGGAMAYGMLWVTSGGG